MEKKKEGEAVRRSVVLLCMLVLFTCGGGMEGCEGLFIYLFIHSRAYFSFVPFFISPPPPPPPPPSSAAIEWGP